MTQNSALNEQSTAKADAGITENGKNNEHNRDINSKTIFQNTVLCAQFLRDNLNIPELKHVQPEEIEDISERYIPYLGTEFASDSVSKIHILDIGRSTGKAVDTEEQEPPFLVSLIDHKSYVDYDVSMQLLRYMMCIWVAYKREMEQKKEGCTRLKSFRYPVIVPIVYYEGKPNWTADRRFSDRIGSHIECREWIPDFRYEVVRIHDYSNEELLARGDEMSLLMLISKIQGASDLEEFIHIPAERLNPIIRDSPGHVLDVIAWVMEGLCFKIDASTEERIQCVQKVRDRDMGYLFANMEHMSLQEERRKTEEQRRKTEEERRKTEEQRRKTEEERRKTEEERRKTEEQRRKTEEERQKAEEQYKRAEKECQRADTAEKQLAEAKKELCEDIMELLEDFGAVPQELRQRLFAEENMSMLRKWYKLAARAQSMEEFVKQL